MAGFAGISGMGGIDLDVEKVAQALTFTGLETVSRHDSPFSSWVAVTHEGDVRRQAAVHRDPGAALMLYGYITGVEGQREAPDGGALAFCADLFRREGPSFAGRLNGSFALAVEDLERGRLHLISDRLGTRNVHFHLAHGLFSFATRLEALRRANPSIADKVSGSALAVFLTLGRLLEGSMLEEAGMLGPARVLTFDGAALAEERYWKPLFSYSANPLSLEDNARRLAKAMGAAVADSVRGWDKVGLLLSGGLDSRMVLSFLGGRDVVCYTACDRRNLETRVAEKAAKHVGAAHVRLLRKASHYRDIVPGAVRVCEGGYEYDHAHLEGLWGAFGDREDRVILSGYATNSVMRTFCLSKLNTSLRAFSRYSYREIAQGIKSLAAVEERLLGLFGSEVDALATMAPALRRDAAGYPREALRRFLGAYDDCAGSPLDLLDIYLFDHLCLVRTFPFLESLRQRFPERCPAVDNRAVAAALTIPPQQRFDSRAFRRALMLADPRLALLADANNCVPAALGGNAALLGRKALKTAERVPTAVKKRLGLHDGLWLQKSGSWYDPGIFWRWGGIHKRLEALLKDEAAMRDGLVSADGVRDLLRNHLEGRAYNHIMLIRVLSFLEWRRSWA